MSARQPRDNTGFIIADVQGTSLSQEEKAWLAHPAILGVILFTRNYEDPNQLTSLCRELKKIKPGLLIAIDQEGGRVQRLREHFTKLPAMREFGLAFVQDPDAALQALSETIRTMVTEIQAVGIDMSLVPVMDIDHGVSDIIGARSFSNDPAIVSQLTRHVIDTLHRHRMPCTAKHFPGHGAVVLDSHIDLPEDTRSFAEIQGSDLVPFTEQHAHIDCMMTAHVRYTAVDQHITTYSAKWLREILRGHIGYEGLIVSDDLTMKAAAIADSYFDRAGMALEAGCDILYVCNHTPGVIEIIDNMGHYCNKQTQARIVTKLYQTLGH